MRQFTSWLYQGNQEDADENMWRPAGITRIVRVSTISTKKEIPFSSTGNFLYLWCPFDDNGEMLTEEILLHIEAFAKIKPFDPLLVHCIAGQNRSVITSAYLLCRVNGYKDYEAVDLIRQKHDDLNVYKTLVEKVKLLTDLDFAGLV